MYVTITNKNNEVEVFAEEEDMCYICANMSKCPLLEVLQKTTVVLRYESIQVESCGLCNPLEVQEIINSIY